MRKTGLQCPAGNVPLLDFSETRPGAPVGGRLEVDGANYGTNGRLSGIDDGFDLRRARITVKGTSLLAVPFGYHIDLGYEPGSFTVSEAWVAIVDVRHLGGLQFGQFTAAGRLAADHQQLGHGLRRRVRQRPESRPES